MARDAHQGSKEDGRERGVQLDIAEDRPAGHAAGPHRLAGLPPLPYDDVAGELLPIAGWWIALHTIVFILVPFMGVALWMLTALAGRICDPQPGGSGSLRTILRCWGRHGISTGILARSAEVGALGERAAVGAIDTLFADPFKSLLFDIGRYAWIVALVMAAVALWRAGAPRLPLVLLGLPAYLVTLDHAFPSGSLTFGTFFVIATWLELASEGSPGPGNPDARAEVSSKPLPRLFDGWRDLDVEQDILR